MKPCVCCPKCVKYPCECPPPPDPTAQAFLEFFKTQTEKSQIDTESLYAITLDDQEVSFVSGQELLDKVEIVGDDNLTVLAKALMACKPPGKKSDWGDATAVVSNLPSE